MPRVHDRGGWPTDEPIDKSEHQAMDWEHRVNAIRQVLGQKALLRSDELRRGIESIEPGRYEALGYYERWTESIESIIVEKGLLTREEIDQKVAALEAQSR
ncbi:MAG: nitrile hydratase [Dehalococcoidia bacterium]